MYPSEELSNDCNLEGNMILFPKCVDKLLDTKTAELKETKQHLVLDGDKNGKNSWS